MNRGNFSSKLGMIVLILAFAFLQMATIRKKDDPILNTQTDPILYKQKMEEIKDGEKGAPSPSFRHYDKADFLAELPMEAEPRDNSNIKPAIPQVGDPIPEDLTGVEETPEDEIKESPEKNLPEGDSKEAPGTDLEEASDEDAWWFDESGEEQSGENDEVKDSDHMDELNEVVPKKKLL